MLEWIQVLDQKGIIYLNNLGTPAQDIFWSNAIQDYIMDSSIHLFWLSYI